MASQLHRNMIQQRQQQQQQPLARSLDGRHNNNNNNSKLAAGCLQANEHSFIGPPPAYEAALRATRLQSLTGSCLALGELAQKPAPDWLQTALSNSSANNSSDHFNYEDERQLDLGDYFHQPRHELQFHGTQLPNGPHAQNGRPGPQPPVMLRLWVRLMEPGELVERARNQTQPDRRRPSVEAQRALPTLRRLSLSRQLSIPQLLGSFMTTLASSKSSATICEGRPAAELAERKSSSDETGRDQQLSSLSSDTNSSAANSCHAPSESRAPHEPDRQEGVRQTGSEGGVRIEMGGARRKQPANESAETNCGIGEHELNGSAAECCATTNTFEQTQLGPAEWGGARATRRRHSIPPIASSITSRVLHMNVASFSYVKDEQLISTKKHNQLNFHHFYAPAKRGRSTLSDEPSGGRGRAPDKASKLCQLLVSICDIENLLNSSAMESRACFRLAQSSSIYVKCEILASASKAANLSHRAGRLLRNPLKLLTQQESSASLAAGQQHATVDFGATIPAAAMEPRPNFQVKVERGGGGEQVASEPIGAPAGEHEAKLEERPPARPPTAGQLNWRHEPRADGKSIVVFNSIPKQIALQQQLASSAGSGMSSFASLSQQQQQQQPDESLRASQQQPIDLIQFDSVFVSPILSKSQLETGFIRLRVYSQCKYLNETCLAELKLPLKQLARTQTRDNLGDVLARSPGAAAGAAAGADGVEKEADEELERGARLSEHQERQADFILNNLLANLVTASTGAPLGALIEQISAEAREEERAHLEQAQPEEPGGFLSSWLTGSSGGGGGGESASQLQRVSSSLGASLNRLAEKRRGEGPAEGRAEWERLMEENYCRSLMVSHWLNYLVAPSYECQPIQEERGKLLLGLTYLPTSNRLIFNAHRASVDHEQCLSGDKQLIKKLRLQSDTCYLLRFLMAANGRVLKRKQTRSARKPEWDSQEPVTFDLASVNVDQPTFIVCLVMRNSEAHATGSLRSLTNYYHQSRTSAGPPPQQPPPQPEVTQRTSAVQSDPECLRSGGRLASGLYRTEAPAPARSSSKGAGRSDLVIGHLVLADDLWHELRSQPRRQIVKQFKLH